MSVILKKVLSVRWELPLLSTIEMLSGIAVGLFFKLNFFRYLLFVFAMEMVTFGVSLSFLAAWLRCRQADYVSVAAEYVREFGFSNIIR